MLEVAWLLSRLSREIRTRFPEENTRGWRFYSLMRAIQLRPAADAQAAAEAAATPAQALLTLRGSYCVSSGIGP